ncbi:MAG: hypothetical protein IJT02_08815 [Synergistaceae bacterium]|nr:hypothetical protein [Synergistaceae bacterium]
MNAVMNLSAKLAKNTAEALLHFLFPVSCPVCGRPGVKVCPECRPYLDDEPAVVLPDAAIPELFSGDVITRSISGLTVHSAVNCDTSAAREAARSLRHSRELCRTLGRHMARSFGDCDADIIIPVPLRLYSRRAFNHAREIAEGLSDVWGIEVWDFALWTREIIHKDTITYEDFRLTRDVYGKRVVLVDDVVSSGRTLSCLAKTCRNDGAEVVCAYTFASEGLSGEAAPSPAAAGHSEKRYKELYRFFTGDVITRQINILTVYSACRYHEGGIREEIHKFKYSGGYGLCWYMGRHMAEKFGECRADYLMPVPLHLNSERTYNQTLLLAEGMCSLWEAEILDAAVWTRDVTRRAVSTGRRELTPSDFAITQDIRGKRIALVDDVCTSGMTLSCLASSCRQNGGVIVCAYTLASV